MTAALGLAKQGFESYLVECTEKLGGHSWKLHYTLEGIEPRKYIEELIQSVKSNDKIKVLLNTNIANTSGHVGNFTTQIDSPDGRSEIRHGAVIVATGGVEYKPTEYLYGQNKNVITQAELEERISEIPGTFKAVKNVVMIQCVGSRDEEHPYCSRYCCSAAIKNAIRLKEMNPERNIYIIYRDIRTYGFKELYYKKAREMGIFFIKYDENIKPEITGNNGRVIVNVFDKELKVNLEIEADIVALAQR